MALLALFGLGPSPPPAHPAVIASAQVKPPQRPAYFNPVFGHTFPDPMVLRAGRSYYAYATHSGPPTPGVFPILRSRDLVHWKPAGYAFRRPPGFSYVHWWAPSALRWRGRYYLFYSALARRHKRMCVAVAVARRATGPFRQRSVLDCGATGGAIDPAPLVVEGRVYLYFARIDASCWLFPRRCSIVGMRLSRDLLRGRGRRRLIGISQPWESRPTYSIVENPWVISRRGRYYLLYSANHWEADYAMGYATSRSPLGPFAKPERRPFLRARFGVVGPGGGSAVTGPRGKTWLAYHARRPLPRRPPDKRRLLHIDRLHVGGGRVRISGPNPQSALRP
ncbi:MAG: family 43 glycosylhydrolase [Actinomycetota bacterium]|nr:family 43 glycosylhydrolase [Actinomycetota bacterium]